MREINRLAAALVCAAGFVACAGEPAEEAAPTAQPDSAAPAVTAVVRVELRDSAGAGVGTADLAQGEGGVYLALHLTGLAPGQHGMHVHQVGSCTGPKFEAAGSHLNPTGKQHGRENPEGPHAGDLPNFTVGADGTADTTVIATGVSFRDESLAVVRPGGSALVLHAGPDDYKTDPSGGSGDRIACGVIAGP